MNRKCITIQGKNGPVSNSKEGYLTFIEAPGLEPHHQIVKSYAQNTCWEGSLTPQQSYSGCFVQPHCRQWAVIFNRTEV